MGASEAEGLRHVIARFGEAARRLCRLVEDAEHHNRDALLRSLLNVLPRLYLEALSLPDVSPSTAHTAAEGVLHAEWPQRFARLGAKLGPRGVYWTVAAFEGGESLPGHLADDLADIYRDLMAGLQLWERGGDAADVVWEWRSSFQNHWGTHLVEALRAIHTLLADYELEEGQ